MPRIDALSRPSIRNLPFSVRFRGGSGDSINFGNIYPFERTDAFSLCGYFFPTRFDTINSTVIRKGATTGAATGWGLFITNTGALSVLLASVASGVNRINVALTNKHRIRVCTGYFWGMAYGGLSQASDIDIALVPIGRPLEAFATKATPVNDNLTSSIVNTQGLRIGATSDGLRVFGGIQQKLSVFAGVKLTLEQFQNIYHLNRYSTPGGASQESSRWIGEDAVGSGATVFDEVGTRDGGFLNGADWDSQTLFNPRTVALSRSEATALRTVAS